MDTIMKSPIGPTRKRVRVTTGYKTCRTRRVKCDERRPICRNCAKRNRTCTYYSKIATDNSAAVSLSRPGQTSHCRPVEEPTSTNANSFEDSFSGTPPNPGESSTTNAGQPPSGEENSVAINETPGTGPRNTDSPQQALTPADLASIFLTHGQISSYDTPGGLQHSQINTFEPTENTQHALRPSYLGNLLSTSSTLLVPERIQLTAAEVPIFRNYVETVSRWIDSFSWDQPFYSVVPVMALQCPVLMQSCLALSSKQLALKSSGSEARISENIAIGYYRKAIKSISSLLADPECCRSDEILASSIILSTYEMFDVVGESFGSHLKGIAFFLQSQQVTGDSSGIKGAAYWTWYRHEIWAALQTGRRMFLSESYWEPKILESFDKLSVEDVANRAIFLFGQCVSFCNDDRSLQEVDIDENQNSRNHRAMILNASLEDWKRKLPPTIAHFFAESPSGFDQVYEFPSIWFIYPQSAIGYQVYHASKILLNLHSTAPITERLMPGRMKSLSLRRQIEKSREQIFLISNAGIPDTWGLISSECLFVAGLVTEGVLEREQTLKLIENCQKSSGRRTFCLADELRKLWSQ